MKTGIEGAAESPQTLDDVGTLLGHHHGRFPEDHQDHKRQQ
jgi:hypothetical protein